MAVEKCSDSEARDIILALLRLNDQFTQKFVDQAIEDWDSRCWEAGCSKLAGAFNLLKRVKEKCDEI